MTKAASAALMASLALPSTHALPVAAQGQGQGQVQFRSTAPEEAQAQATLDRFARARDNLVALREGRRALGDLTAEELQDVVDFDRRVRGDYPDNRSPRQRCIDDEVRRERGEPSPLAWQVIRLKCRD